MRAYEFNISGTDRAFFSSVYGREYHDQIPLDLWRAKGRIALRIEPVETKAGMFRLTPEVPLVPGRYAMYFGDALHQSNVVFATQERRQAVAFYFAILERATEPEEGIGDTWEALGRRHLQLMEVEEAEKAFAKALEKAETLSFKVFVEGWRPKFAVLKVSSREIALIDGSNEILFRAAPAEVAIEKVGSGAPLLAVKHRGFLKVKIGKQSWTLNPVPDGSHECAAEGGYYPCSGRALVQQTWLASYLGRLIQQLGSQEGKR